MTEKIKVKILKDMDQFAWEDGKVYGPFKKGEIIEIPRDVAEILQEKNAIEIQKDLKNRKFQRFLIASDVNSRVWLIMSESSIFLTISNRNGKTRVPVNILELIKAFQRIKSLLEEVIP